MKESIYTIPISEVFEPRAGCPVCALRAALEKRWTEYVTGPAMMEPDVRLRTNEEGFCARHLNAMLALRNRLPVALLLQTRIEYLLERLEKKPAPAWKKRGHAAAIGCFVCGRVERELERLAGNIAAIWAREESFRELYAEQEILCVPHHGLLSQMAEGLRGASRASFLAATNALVLKGLTSAKADVDAFCRLYDHRSDGERPPERVAGAVENAASLLCGSPSHHDDSST